MNLDRMIFKPTDGETQQQFEQKLLVAAVENNCNVIGEWPDKTLEVCVNSVLRQVKRKPWKYQIDN